MADLDLSNLASQLDAATQVAPLQNTPTAFAAWAAPAAQQAAQKTGIDPATIIGIWGNETGWGQHIIPGTNNLGNVKTQGSGTAPGVPAVDNQLGTKSNYQSYPSIQDFGNAWANLIASRYPDAIGTGTNAAATAKALAAGGYAEDPNYASKVLAASGVVAKAGGIPLTASGAPGDPASQAQPQGASDNDITALASALDQAGIGRAPSNVPSQGYQLGSTEQLLKQYQIPDAAQASQQAASAGPSGVLGNIEAVGAGAGQGFGKTVLGAQALVGKGLTALGSTQVGPWLTKDAQTGAANLDQQADAVGGKGLAQGVGNFVGEAVPAVVAGPEIGTQALAGAATGAGSAALNNQPILPAAVEGGGLGAGGAAIGHTLGAAVAGAKPVISKALDKITGGENAAVANIANAATDVDSAASNMAKNSGEIIPGSTPTAAETANDAGISAFQRGIQNTAAGQERFSATQANNDAARLAAGQTSVGDVGSDASTFTQAQAARIAQGQAELPPVTQAQADVMQTPAYQTAIAAAKKSASDAGVSAFDDQSANVQQGLKAGIDAVAGTPETLEAARNARTAQAEVDYGKLAGSLPVTTPGFADLQARPEFMSALNEAANREATRLGISAPEPFIQSPPVNKMVVDPTTGELGWQQIPGQQFVNTRLLQQAKTIMEDDAGSLYRSGKNNAANATDSAKKALDQFLTENVPAYKTANENFKTNSVPIDQQAALQTRLNGAVNPLTNEVSPAKLSGAVNSIAGEQMKPGIRPADRITPEQTAQLVQLGKQAKAAPGNMVGLNGEGQEAIRQELAARAEKSPAQSAAHMQYANYLSANSPAYSEFHTAAQTTGKELASRQALDEHLQRSILNGNNARGEAAISLNQARAMVQDPRITGAQRDYVEKVFADLQRRSTMHAATGAAGSQTAANQLSKHGLLGQLMDNSMTEKMLTGAIMGGKVLAAPAIAVARAAMAQANQRTEAAAIDLLHNPEALSKALSSFKQQPTAAAAFMTALRQKAGTGTIAGASLLHALGATASPQTAKD